MNRNIIIGSSDSEIINGTNGNDILIGGAGYNEYNLGKGKDIIVITPIGNNIEIDYSCERDVIYGFGLDDRLDLSQYKNLDLQNGNNLSFSQDGYDVILTLPDMKEVVIKDFYHFPRDVYINNWIIYNKSESEFDGKIISDPNSSLSIGSDKDDVIIPGNIDHEVLIGKNGSDIFVFNGYGEKIIADFDASEDVLYFGNVLFKDLIIGQNWQGDTYIYSYGSDTSFLLKNVHPWELTEDNFCGAIGNIDDLLWVFRANEDGTVNTDCPL